MYCLLRRNVYHIYFYYLCLLGDKYIGDWSKGEMHGMGVKSQADGSILEGEGGVSYFLFLVSCFLFLFLVSFLFVCSTIASRGS